MSEKAYEKHAWKFFVNVVVLLLLHGSQYIFIGVGLIPPFREDRPIYAQKALGMTWNELAATNPKIANFVISILGFLGLPFLAVSALTLSVSMRAFRRGDRWALYALWSVPLLTASQITIEVTHGFPVPTLPTIALPLALLGLLLPFRKFFPKGNPR